MRAVLNWFAATHHRLEDLLEERAAVEEAAVAALTGDVLAGFEDGELGGRALAAWRARIGSLEVGEAHADDEPEQVSRRGAHGPEGQWRWRLRYRLSGNPSLLDRWPASLSEAPCGEQREPTIAAPRWSIEVDDNEAAVVCDVPTSEDPEGVHPPSARLLDGDAYLRDAVAAIGADIDRFASDLAPRLEESVRRRRARLGMVSAEMEKVISLVRPLSRPLTLHGSDETTTPPDSGPLLHVRLALSAESFDDLLDVVRRWRRGVEAYPAAFSALSEETVSSLLVTTLGAVFSSVGREVFQGAGKTDILVSGDEAGSAAHIAEAKVWRGKGGVEPALRQALGYAIARTERLLLLWYVRQKQLHSVQDAAEGALADVVELVERVDKDGGDLAAHVTHPVHGHRLVVHVLFVHVPRP